MQRTSLKPPPATTTPRRQVAAGDVVVVMRREIDGPEIGRERVAEADLADVFSEMWLDRWLDQGLPDVPFESLRQRIVFGPPDARGAQFAFEAVDPSGRATRRRYGLDVFQDAASRGSQRLLASEVLKPNDTYYYDVTIDPQRADAPANTFRVTPKHPPLAVAPCPIGRLEERAQRVGDCEGWTAVFFTREALAAAERHSRRGAGLRSATGASEPIETGCVLAGPLVSCPDTGRLAVVITDSLELVASEGTCFSLAYTADTWRRIQAIMRARQAQPATRAHRVLGQAHGHNFRPSYNTGEGENTCADCPKRKTCHLTSVFVSQDDRAWSRAVFSRQPWQLALIYGYDARGNDTHALFGLRDNRLAERGYYVVDDYRPEES